MRQTVVGLLLSYFGVAAFAQTPIVVSASAWHSLAQAEREAIQAKHIVQTMPADGFGVILDNQGIDRSTPGSAAGSNIGQAVGSATYIDRALSGGNYSARDHLGAMVIGALIGSAFNTQRNETYQFRYAVRLGNGNVGYHDIVSGSPFRHPAGVCVTVPEISLISDQSICNQNADVLRRNYLGSQYPSPAQLQDMSAVTARSQASNPESNAGVSPEGAVLRSSDEALVRCKVGSLPPVQTSQMKCELINGVVEK